MSEEIYTKNGVITEGTYFNDAAIIPSLEYQVYGIDKAWFWDNEGISYNYGDEKSNITITVPVETVTKTYYSIVDNEGTKELSEPIENPTPEQVEGATKIKNTSADLSNFSNDDIVYTEEKTTSEVEITDPYEYNKYGNLKPFDVISVTIEPNSTLVGKFPNAIVVIDGKDYDLKYLNNPITFYMDRDHKISIKWIWGSCVETFRIICNR